MHNDPVNCVDLWGLEDYQPITEEIKQLYIASGGNPDLDFDALKIYDRMPTVEEVKQAAKDFSVDLSIFSDDDIQQQIDNSAAMSLPGGKVFVPSSDPAANGNRTANELKALTAHEVEHQNEYATYGVQATFAGLVVESQMDYPNPYKTPGYLEYEAQIIEDRANTLLDNGWNPSKTDTQQNNISQCSNN